MTEEKKIKKYELMWKIRQYQGIHIKYMPNMAKFELIDILETLQKYLDGEVKDYKNCREQLSKRYLL
jgi:hypothetical protein